ncbi:DUF1275 family protein, partial [Paraburkholderia xenovorans]|uniref:DUF1275 family protein n=1 Tax=Paraburkholderia xenovorans TaxID=36873 RepID=UPI0038B78193
MKYADSAPAAVAGYVDTLSFVALFGPFTPHVTGNFVLTAAAAMGVQNTHGRLIARAGVPNTVMTSNVTQAVLDALELVSSEVTAEVKSAARTRLGKTLHAVARFGAGAIAGALAYRYVVFWALLVPFAVLVWLAAVDRDEPGLTD